MIVNFKWADNWLARSRRSPAPVTWLDRPDLGQLALPNAVLPPFVAACPLATPEFSPSQSKTAKTMRVSVLTAV